MKSPVSGFTLIEMAIVMVVIGLLAGGGTFVMGMLTERKARNESIDYLHQAKEALISHADTQGFLPSADTDQDGTGDGATAGGFPYLDLKVRPTDLYKRVLRYELNPNLSTDLQTTCSALKTGLSGAPDVVDGDGSSTAFSVAAVLVSSGPMDADGDGNILDRINHRLAPGRQHRPGHRTTYGSLRPTPSTTWSSTSASTNCTARCAIT